MLRCPGGQVRVGPAQAGPGPVGEGPGDGASEHVDALAAARHHRHDRDVERALQCGGVDVDAAGTGDVDHDQRDHDRNPRVGDLRGR